MKRSIVSILFLAVFGLNKGQIYEVVFDHIRQEDESLINVTNIAQDKQGFIWLRSVTTGLKRYDGYEFRSFIDSVNTYIETEFEKRGFLIDSRGLIWLSNIKPNGTYRGLTVYNPEDENRIDFCPDTTIEGMNTGTSINNITDIVEDSSGTLWCATGGGLLKLSLKTLNFNKDTFFKKGVLSMFNVQSFIIQSEQNFGQSNFLTNIFEDSNQNLWVGGLGLYLFLRDKNEFLRIDDNTNNHRKLSNPYVQAIVQENAEVMWVGTRSGINRVININSLKNQPADIASLKIESFTTYFVTSLTTDNRNQIWAGTQTGGLLKLTYQNNQPVFKAVYPDLETKEGNDFRWVYSLLNDKSGMIHSGHTNSVLRRFRPERDQFHYKNMNCDVQRVHACENGNIWCFTLAFGVIMIDKHGKEKSYDITDESVPGQNGNCIISYLDMGNNIFWLGTTSGLWEFNSITGKSKKLLRDRNFNYCLIDLMRVRDFILMGTDKDGMFVYNLKTNHLQHFLHQPDNKTGLRSDKIMALCSMKNGDLYAGGLNGICRFRLDTLTGNVKFLPVNIAPGVLDEFGFFCALYGSSDNVLWGGANNGLIRLDPATGNYQIYKRGNGMICEIVNSIQEDNNGNMWFGTTSGIQMINPKTGKMAGFDKSNGLPHRFQIFHAVYKNKQGELFYGASGGIYYFHPQKILKNTFIPPVVITDFLLNNKSVKIDTAPNAILTKNISYTRSIDLNYRENDISFAFAALDYSCPAKNKYAFMLEGYDKDWIYTDAANRTATYTNLPPKKYIFRVKGSNDEGIWNETGTSIHIFIHPPWWATNFARIMYFVAFILLIYGFIKWRLRSLNKEKAVLEGIVQARTAQLEEQKEEIEAQKDRLQFQNEQIKDLDKLKNRFFANISHEFRTPLSLIQSPVEELLNDSKKSEKEKKKLKIVSRNASRLLDLVNQLLDISKIDSCNMRLELVNDDLGKFLSQITQSFCSHAETKSISYKVINHVNSFECWFDSDKIEKIAFNLLSNAFKFTPEGGEVKVEASLQNQVKNISGSFLTFSVQDTGPGIPEDCKEKIFNRFYQLDTTVKSGAGGTGIGLSLVKDLVKLLHGDITVESKEGKGSLFTVMFPLGREHLMESEYMLMRSEVIPKLKYHEIENPPVRIIGNMVGNKDIPTILIVEDNSDIRLQLSDNLSDKYIIQEAVDGYAGLKMALGVIPDLVLTDLMMPRLDGMELCKKLKSDERTSHIPVVILTAKGAMEDRIAGLQIGADDYVPKPFNISELKVRIGNLIETRKKLRERFSREVTLEPQEISITPADEKFLKRAIAVIESHIGEENFDVPEFRSEMNMSRSTLFRKLYALTNQSPSEFIRTIRLKRAACLLKQGFGNVSQVALEVGFNNLSYFTRCFKQMYQLSPVELLKEKTIEN